MLAECILRASGLRVRLEFEPRGGIEAIITPLYLTPFLLLLGREAVLHPSTLLLLLSD